MSITRRSLLQWSVAAPLAAGNFSLIQAAEDSWPTKPIKLIVAFAPGGFTDIAAVATRVLAGHCFVQQPTLDEILKVDREARASYGFV